MDFLGFWICCSPLNSAFIPFFLGTYPFFALNYHTCRQLMTYYYHIFREVSPGGTVGICWTQWIRKRRRTAKNAKPIKGNPLYNPKPMISRWRDVNFKCIQLGLCILPAPCISSVALHGEKDSSRDGWLASWSLFSHDEILCQSDEFNCQRDEFNSQVDEFNSQSEEFICQRDEFNYKFTSLASESFRQLKVGR